MNVSDFDFTLPPELIAQQPPAQRGASRMMTLDRTTGQVADRCFSDLVELLQPGDLLVLNDSRVIPARLLGKRALADGSLAPGEVEVLLVEEHEDREWTALARPGKHLREGARVVFRDDARLEVEIVSCADFGERRIRFAAVEDFWRRLDACGHMPLPPYIRRADIAEDHERYQTVFAKHRGSVAAPTAGLHFTPQILDEIRQRGVQVEQVTLHVGLGTFQPIRVESLEQHAMHEERYTLGASAATALQAAVRDGRRVVAVGTTVVRTLEHCARQPGGLQPHSGRTSIFIYPRSDAGREFRIVNAMLTNFHLPQSTLLMLVCAFAGRENVLAAYAHAVRERYRFFSYGDCMFLS
jgi:S-adenosylmethionine:tRNA ribosyltransferase-isomerase